MYDPSMRMYGQNMTAAGYYPSAGAATAATGSGYPGPYDQHAAAAAASQYQQGFPPNNYFPGQQQQCNGGEGYGNNPASNFGQYPGLSNFDTITDPRQENARHDKP